jgi:hypothetical protein
MPRHAVFLVVLALALSVFSPAIARGPFSGTAAMGSRGSRTAMAPGASAGGAYAGGAAMGSYAGGYGSGHGYGYGGGYGGRRGFGGALLGGMMGFGLAHALFGHHGGFGGGMGLLGMIIRLVLLFFLVRWVLRLIFRRTTGWPGGGAAAGYGMATAAPAAAAPALSAPLAVQPGDFEVFEVLLKNIEAAWSNNDVAALHEFATPEIAATLARQLADNARRGVRNVVTDVTLQKGDLSEAWSEPGADFATVRMRYAMRDATYDQSGHVVEGSAATPVTETEYWTFTRPHGGRWMLSAVQKAG